MLTGKQALGVDVCYRNTCVVLHGKQIRFVRASHLVVVAVFLLLVAALGLETMMGAAHATGSLMLVDQGGRRDVS